MSVSRKFRPGQSVYTMNGIGKLYMGKAASLKFAIYKESQLDLTKKAYVWLENGTDVQEKDTLRGEDDV